MSTVNPPSEFVPIFNPSYYSSGSSNLTLDEANSLYAKLSGSVIRGLTTFQAGLSTPSISNAGLAFTMPGSSGQFALVSQIPSLSSYVTLNDDQTIQNKTFQFSSNTSIASIATPTFTTSFAHGLAVGDTVSFPSVGSITGITANTNYTIDTVASTTQFTLFGVASIGGTVGTAYYILVNRFPTNYSTNGGEFRLIDANNTTRPLVFDIAGATQPIVMRVPLTTAAPIIFPSTGGTVAVLSATQSFTGTTTFTGQVLSTRAGNSAAASSPIYINPSSSTAMSGANSYTWTYFNTPVTSGTTTGNASTLTIAGGPTVAASGGNYALRIIASQSSIPAGTVAAPSLVFGTAANSSGLYSSANNVINVGISGTAIATVNSTGLSIAGLISGTSLVAGGGALATPSIYMTGDTGTGFYRSAAGNWDWVTSNTSYFRVSNTGITSTAANIVNTTTTGGLKVATTGSLISQIQQGVFLFTNVPVPASSSLTQTFSFSAAFTSAPNVQLTVNYVGTGGGHDKCIVLAASITTTQVTVYVYNTNPSASATGNISIAYIASN